MLEYNSQINQVHMSARRHILCALLLCIYNIERGNKRTPKIHNRNEHNDASITCCIQTSSPQHHDRGVVKRAKCHGKGNTLRGDVFRSSPRSLGVGQATRGRTGSEGGGGGVKFVTFHAELSPFAKNSWSRISFLICDLSQPNFIFLERWSLVVHVVVFLPKALQ